jgi:hypothetical protein
VVVLFEKILYQGIASAMPQTSGNTSGFSRWGFWPLKVWAALAAAKAGHLCWRFGMPEGTP